MRDDDLDVRIRQMIDEGVPKAEIARRLGISRKTLYTHLAKLEGPGAIEHGEVEIAKTTGGNTRGGAPLRNKNAVVTGEYETLWDDGLTETERVAMRAAWQLPTLEQVNRQLGLLDVQIARVLSRVNQTRSALSIGLELQLDRQVRSEGGMFDITTTESTHTRNIMERQEKALERLLHRRERLLALRVSIELKAAELKAAAEANAGGPSNQFTVRFVASDG